MNNGKKDNGNGLIVAPKPAIIITNCMPGQASNPIPREFSGYNVPIIGQ